MTVGGDHRITTEDMGCPFAHKITFFRKVHFLGSLICVVGVGDDKLRLRERPQVNVEEVTKIVPLTNDVRKQLGGRITW